MEVFLEMQRISLELDSLAQKVTKYSKSQEQFLQMVFQILI